MKSQHRTKRGEMPAGYGIVQKAVMRMAGLPAVAKAVYALLASYTGAEGWCWPSQAQIASDLCISRSTVLRSLSELEEAGLVRRSKLYGDFRRNTKYKLMIVKSSAISQRRNIQGVTGETLEGVAGETRKKNTEDYQEDNKHFPPSPTPSPEGEGVHRVEADASLCAGVPATSDDSDPEEKVG